MISRLCGELVQLTENTATLRVGGVFYDLLIPSGLHDTLRSTIQSTSDEDSSGSTVTLYTIYYIEAGDMKSTHYPRMIGFTDSIDREFFQLFTSVPGLGVKKALKSLVLPISEIARFIEEKNPAGLSRLPGVGPRLSEKIVAELSGKTAKFALALSSKPLTQTKVSADDYVDEALQALIQLQYNRQEAEEMIRAAMSENPKVKSAEELIALVFAASQARV